MTSVSVTLTPEQIQDVTGFRQRCRQIAQLKAMGVPYLINGRGDVVLTREALNHALFGEREREIVDI